MPFATAQQPRPPFPLARPPNLPPADSLPEQLSSRWADPRVAFQQLSDNPLDNELQLSEIWVPDYALDNAVFPDRLSYARGVGVRRSLVAHKNGSGETGLVEGREGKKSRRIF